MMNGMMKVTDHNNDCTQKEVSDFMVPSSVGKPFLDKPGTFDPKMHGRLRETMMGGMMVMDRTEIKKAGEKLALQVRRGEGVVLAEELHLPVVVDLISRVAAEIVRFGIPDGEGEFSGIVIDGVIIALSPFHDFPIDKYCSNKNSNAINLKHVNHSDMHIGNFKFSVNS